MKPERHQELVDFLQEDFVQANEYFALTYESYLKLHEDLACDLLTDEVEVNFNTELLLVIRKELDRIDYNQDFANQCFN